MPSACGATIRPVAQIQRFTLGDLHKGVLGARRIETGVANTYGTGWLIILNDCGNMFVDRSRIALRSKPGAKPG